MGSFDYTCCVSGLPIGYGEKVRYFLLTQNPYHEGEGNACYLHSLWFPRTIPLVGTYDDYGRVKLSNNATNKVVLEAWLETLKLDVVEMGWGDNSYHDVPVTQDMNYDQLINAVWEGRLRVKRNRRKLKLNTELREKFTELLSEETPKGVPTLASISEILNGQKMYTEKTREGIMIDEVDSGCVRVRYATVGETNFGKNEQFLLPIQSILNSEYATVITTDIGNYPDQCALFVYPKPGVKRFRLREEEDKSLIVNHAMIREDVWQALLSIPMENWRTGKLMDLKEETKTLQASMKKLFKKQAKENTIESVKRYLLEQDLRVIDGVSWILMNYNDVGPTVGIGTHVEIMASKKTL